MSSVQSEQVRYGGMDREGERERLGVLKGVVGGQGQGMAVVEKMQLGRDMGLVSMFLNVSLMFNNLNSNGLI